MFNQQHNNQTHKKQQRSVKPVFQNQFSKFVPCICAKQSVNTNKTIHQSEGCSYRNQHQQEEQYTEQPKSVNDWEQTTQNTKKNNKYQNQTKKMKYEQSDNNLYSNNKQYSSTNKLGSLSNQQHQQCVPQTTLCSGIINPQKGLINQQKGGLHRESGNKQGIACETVNYHNKITQNRELHNLDTKNEMNEFIKQQKKTETKDVKWAIWEHYDIIEDEQNKINDKQKYLTNYNKIDSFTNLSQYLSIMNEIPHNNLENIFYNKDTQQLKVYKINESFQRINGIGVFIDKYIPEWSSLGKDGAILSLMFFDCNCFNVFQQIINTCIEQFVQNQKYQQFDIIGFRLIDKCDHSGVFFRFDIWILNQKNADILTKWIFQTISPIVSIKFKIRVKNIDQLTN